MCLGTERKFWNICQKMVIIFELFFFQWTFVSKGYHNWPLHNIRLREDWDSWGAFNIYLNFITWLVHQMIHESNIPTETCARDLTACSILNWRKMRWRNEVFDKDFLKYTQLFFLFSKFSKFSKTLWVQVGNIKNGNSICFDPEFVEYLCQMQGARFSSTVTLG